MHMTIETNVTGLETGLKGFSIRKLQMIRKFKIMKDCFGLQNLETS